LTLPRNFLVIHRTENHKLILRLRYSLFPAFFEISFPTWTIVILKDVVSFYSLQWRIFHLQQTVTMTYEILWESIIVFTESKLVRNVQHDMIFFILLYNHVFLYKIWLFIRKMVCQIVAYYVDIASPCLSSWLFVIYFIFSYCIKKVLSTVFTSDLWIMWKGEIPFLRLSNSYNIIGYDTEASKTYLVGIEENDINFVNKHGSSSNA
jgi:hypothetical protein